MISSTVDPPTGERRRTATGSGAAFDFSPWEELPPLPVLAPRTPTPRRNRACSVGIWERAAALVLLVVVSPLTALIALAIKIDSPRGPVFYRQERVGLDRRCRRPGRKPAPAGSVPAVDRRRSEGLGQTFWICKFRTMMPEAEKLTGPVWARQADPRVTRVGRVLRNLRLDELPQLLNVVQGHMRLIGPRPERPHFVRQLAREIPEYSVRHAVFPGITGLAQVEREYDSSINDVRTKLKYDLFYVQHKCGLLDLKILIKTLDVVFRGRGAH